MPYALYDSHLLLLSLSKTQNYVQIAIQKGNDFYEIRSLPECIKKFFPGISGIMNLVLHKEWKDSAIQESKVTDAKIRAKLPTYSLIQQDFNKLIGDLKKQISEAFSKGSVANVVSIIESIAFFNDDNYENLSTNQSPEQRLQESLNKLQGVPGAFTVAITSSKPEELRYNLPEGAEHFIKISQNKTIRRTIFVAIFKNGHAEIINIIPATPPSTNEE